MTTEEKLNQKMRTKKEILERIAQHKEYQKKCESVIFTNPNGVIGASIGLHSIKNQIDELQWVLGKEDEPDTRDLRL
jgi:hypothetical protein